MTGFLEGFIWMTFCVYFEAENQPQPAREMVCHSILNRAVKRKLTYKEVVREKGQYSWYNKRVIPPVKNGLVFIECAQAVLKSYFNHSFGYNYGGVDHFFSDDIEEPYWVPSMSEKLGKVGAFYYFRS